MNLTVVEPTVPLRRRPVHMEITADNLQQTSAPYLKSDLVKRRLTMYASDKTAKMLKTVFVSRLSAPQLKDLFPHSSDPNLIETVKTIQLETETNTPWKIEVIGMADYYEFDGIDYQDLLNDSNYNAAIGDYSIKTFSSIGINYDVLENGMETAVMETTPLTSPVIAFCLDSSVPPFRPSVYLSDLDRGNFTSGVKFDINNNIAGKYVKESLDLTQRWIEESADVDLVKQRCCCLMDFISHKTQSFELSPEAGDSYIPDDSNIGLPRNMTAVTEQEHRLENVACERFNEEAMCLEQSSSLGDSGNYCYARANQNTDDFDYGYTDGGRNVVESLSEMNLNTGEDVKKTMRRWDVYNRPMRCRVESGDFGVPKLETIVEEMEQKTSDTKTGNLVQTERGENFIRHMRPVCVKKPAGTHGGADCRELKRKATDRGNLQNQGKPGKRSESVKKKITIESGSYTLPWGSCWSKATLSDNDMSKQSGDSYDVSCREFEPSRESLSRNDRGNEVTVGASSINRETTSTVDISDDCTHGDEGKQLHTVIVIKTPDVSSREVTSPKADVSSDLKMSTVNDAHGMNASRDDVMCEQEETEAGKCEDEQCHITVDMSGDDGGIPVGYAQIPIIKHEVYCDVLSNTEAKSICSADGSRLGMRYLSVPVPENTSENVREMKTDDTNCIKENVPENDGEIAGDCFNENQIGLVSENLDENCIIDELQDADDFNESGFEDITSDYMNNKSELVEDDRIAENCGNRYSSTPSDEAVKDFAEISEVVVEKILKESMGYYRGNFPGEIVDDERSVSYDTSLNSPSVAGTDHAFISMEEGIHGRGEDRVEINRGFIEDTYDLDSECDASFQEMESFHSGQEGHTFTARIETVVEIIIQGIFDLVVGGSDEVIGGEQTAENYQPSGGQTGRVLAVGNIDEYKFVGVKSESDISGTRENGKFLRLDNNGESITTLMPQDGGGNILKLHQPTSDAMNSGDIFNNNTSEGGSDVSPGSSSIMRDDNKEWYHPSGQCDTEYNLNGSVNTVCVEIDDIGETLLDTCDAVDRFKDKPLTFVAVEDYWCGGIHIIVEFVD